MNEVTQQVSSPLSEYELKTVLPEVAKILQGCIGKNASISNKQIIKMLESSNIIEKETGIRKIIHHIRLNGIVKTGEVIANGKGYYISSDEKEILEYHESLFNRETAIKNIRIKIFERISKKLQYKLIL